jgi:hypothetical protein
MVDRRYPLENSFYNLVKDGKIYEFISSITGWDRNVVKRNLIAFLYSKSNMMIRDGRMTDFDYKGKEITEVFTNHFPKVLKFLSSEKLSHNGEGRELARLLQTRELYFLEVQKMLIEKYPNEVFITKHDSIQFKSSLENIVGEVISLFKGKGNMKVSNNNGQESKDNRNKLNILFCEKEREERKKKEKYLYDSTYGTLINNKEERNRERKRIEEKERKILELELTRKRNELNKEEKEGLEDFLSGW